VSSRSVTEQTASVLYVTSITHITSIGQIVSLHSDVQPRNPALLHYVTSLRGLFWVGKFQ